VLWFPGIKSPKLKSDLLGKKFTSDDEVISAILDHFKDKNSEYFFSGIQKLINRSKKMY
jgi:hypothetical protein